MADSTGHAGRMQRRLAQMAGIELGWRVVAGELLAWAVTALALVMSYHAEQDLGQSLSAFRGWPALVWPLSVDVADVGLMVLYLEYKRLRLSTWKVWLGMVAATTVMIAANVRSAWPDPTAVAMQAWVPSIALWLWHTLAAGRRPRGAPVDLSAVWLRLTGEPDAPADEPPAALHPEQAGDEQPDEPNRHAHVPARAEVRRLLRRHGNRLTPEVVAKRSGVSIPHARRLLRQERALRVVETPGEPSTPGAEGQQ
jgi:Protein of unknown function (DUF2637)